MRNQTINLNRVLFFAALFTSSCLLFPVFGQLMGLINIRNFFVFLRFFGFHKKILPCQAELEVVEDT